MKYNREFEITLIIRYIKGDIKSYSNTDNLLEQLKLLEAYNEELENLRQIKS